MQQIILTLPRLFSPNKSKALQKKYTSVALGSTALRHRPTSSHTHTRMIWNPKNPNQVHYSAAPIISIIASIVVVFVMSLITGAGV